MPRLVAPSLEIVERARLWRNADLAPWRTPYYLTADQQEQFYRDIVSNRHAAARYWGVSNDYGEVVAFCGLCPLSAENGCGEISLVVDPDRAGNGYGAAVVALVLAEAFDRMRLLTVHAECYTSNPALGFWVKQADRWGALKGLYPRRKFWQGRLHDAELFAFTAEEWRERRPA